ncbi:MAG: AAA family ATPase [Alphaproteobacteria bacterium]|nr:AAA family ATPase [Alphaproteobacteria bacterium]
MSKITHLKLENLTAFKAFDRSFSSGINVLIGANGTGKTHLLKTLYAACAITDGEDLEKSFAQKLRNVFSPYEGRIGRLATRTGKSVNVRISVTRKEGQTLSVELSNHTKTIDGVTTTGETTWKKNKLSCAYIPVKEMLSNAPGFLSMASKREISFDETYSDIIKKAFLPKLLGPTDEDRRRLLSALQEAIEGKVISKGEHFFLKNRQGDLEFTLLAEGIRKLALIWLLIQNGTLLSGSILFWDEPEANLNPSLLGQVVEVVLELQRLGVQVFLTTHNYVLLKEFYLRGRQDDKVWYTSLFRDEKNSTVSSSQAEEYNSIDNNKIMETFSDLYDRDVAKALGRDR